MAIAQRQFSHAAARPALRPSARPARPPRLRPQPRAARRTAPLALAVPALIAVAFTGVLVAYVAGFAQMTGVNFQRVQLHRELQSLRAQHQQLHTELILRRDNKKIKAWAEANRMTPAPPEALYLR